jgi:hypothetical protein
MAEKKNNGTNKIIGLLFLALALIPLVIAAILHGAVIGVGNRLVLIIIGAILLFLGVFFRYCST